MSMSAARKAANDKYLGEQDDIKLRVPKGRRDELKAIVKEIGSGESFNEFAIKAIEERIARRREEQK